MAENEETTGAPTTPTLDTGATPAVSEDPNWASFVEDDVDSGDVKDSGESLEDIPPAAAVTTPPPEPPPSAPATPPVTAPVTPPPIQPQTPPVQTAPVVVPPAPTPTPTPTPPVSPEVLRQQAFDELAKTYAVPPEVAAQLITEPEVVLPKLLAQTHMNALTQAVQMLRAQVPTMLQAQTAAEKAQEKSANAFYAAWPKLAAVTEPAQQETILRTIRAYRAQNEQATPEQVIKEAGAIAMFTLGLAVDTPVAPAAAQTAAAPTIPPAPAGVGSATAAAPAKEQNPFVVLSREFEDDD